MQQHFTHTEMTDRYLKGKLSESERVAFEEKIQQDPLLASEINLQRDIYQALGETRKMALKNRLNQVPIRTTPWRGFPVAAAVGTLLLVGAGYYYQTSWNEPTENMASVNEEVTYLETSPLNSTPVTPAPIPEARVSKVADQPATAERSRPTRPQARRAPSPKAPVIVRPDVVSEFDEDSPSVDYRDFNAPEKQALQGNNYRKEDVAIETLSDSDYDFHYQFYDNKLYLHGDFQGTPYKIIALNTEADKKLFLEFDHAYYGIGVHREAVPLVKIKDTTLVKSLRELSHID